MNLDLANHACVEVPDDMASSDIKNFMTGVRRKSVQFFHDHGALAYECAKTKLRVAHLHAVLGSGSGSHNASATFKVPLNRHPDWGETTISFGLLAKKKRGSLQFCIVYPVYTSFPPHVIRDSSRWGHLQHDHWHLEPIEIGNGILQSCVASQLHDGLPTVENCCPKCHTRRWTQSLDKFWPLPEYSAQDRARREDIGTLQRGRREHGLIT